MQEVKKMNVKVGDVVCVHDCYGSDYLSVVDKVLPNGRFRLRFHDYYWKKDGTRNTKASAKERVEYVTLANTKEKEQFYWTLTGERLVSIGKTLEMDRYKNNQSTNDLICLNKILDCMKLFRDSEFVEMDKQSDVDKTILKNQGRIEYEKFHIN